MDLLRTVCFGLISLVVWFGYIGPFLFFYDEIKFA